MTQQINDYINTFEPSFADDAWYEPMHQESTSYEQINDILDMMDGA